MSVSEIVESNPRMTEIEAAGYLGVARATLTTWRSRGGGPPFYKVCARVVYTKEDLDSWLAERKVAR
jgi:hypothetical protein